MCLEVCAVRFQVAGMSFEVRVVRFRVSSTPLHLQPMRLRLLGTTVQLGAVRLPQPPASRHRATRSTQDCTMRVLHRRMRPRHPTLSVPRPGMRGLHRTHSAARSAMSASRRTNSAWRSATSASRRTNSASRSAIRAFRHAMRAFRFYRHVVRLRKGRARRLHDGARPALGRLSPTALGPRETINAAVRSPTPSRWKQKERARRTEVAREATAFARLETMPVHQQTGAGKAR